METINEVNKIPVLHIGQLFFASHLGAIDKRHEPQQTL
jgi:hypothetical protein